MMHDSEQWGGRADVQKPTIPGEMTNREENREMRDQIDVK